MNIDIRKSIINNFKDSNLDEIKESIENSISEGEEITLPGLGVFFELLWKNTQNKNDILNTIYESINKN